MKLPKIEEEINKKGSRINSALGFLALGASAVVASYGLPGLASLVVAMPLAFDAYTMKNLLNEQKGSKTNLLFYEPIFKNGMKKWVRNYLEDSEDISEKKYKVVLLSLWMRHKKLSMESLFDFDYEAFDEVSDELSQKKLTKFPLVFLLSPQESHIQENYGKDLTPDYFIKEDINYPERIEIAKKVYQEYINTGMASKQFLTNQPCEGLLLLQDGKFTATDYLIIDNFNKQQFLQENKNEHSPLQSIALGGEKAKEVLVKIVENEEDTSKLKILESYCHKAIELKSFIDSSAIEEMIGLLKTKIKYTELKKEMNVNEETPKKTKKPKI
jgi:hypothetical protein